MGIRFQYENDTRGDILREKKERETGQFGRINFHSNFLSVGISSRPLNFSFRFLKLLLSFRVIFQTLCSNDLNGRLASLAELEYLKYLESLIERIYQIVGISNCVWIINFDV